MVRLLSQRYTFIAVLFVFAALFISCGGGGGGGGGTSAPTAQGSIANPVVLALNTPYQGSVDRTASYYRVPVTAGATYTVSVTGMTDDVDLMVFTNSAYTDLPCWSMQDLTVDDQCSATATSTALYVMIIGSYTNGGAYFTITVTQPPPLENVAAVPGFGLATITWPRVSGATSYNIYWSTTPGLGTSGTKITGATSPYVHTGRTTGTTYYYVVTAVTAAGEIGPSSQVSATPMAATTTLPNANFDDGTLQGWYATGTWAVTTAHARSGAYSVTDSPGSNYTNYANTFLQSPVLDLTGTGTPTLTFYHRYATENYWDYCYVEVSTNGGQTFTTVGTYSGTLSTFPTTPVTISLSAYKSATTVIRFRLHSDMSYTYDGWYIDDILITP